MSKQDQNTIHHRLSNTGTEHTRHADTITGIDTGTNTTGINNNTGTT